MSDIEKAIKNAVQKLRKAGFSTNQAILGIHIIVEKTGQRIESEDLKRHEACEKKT